MRLRVYLALGVFLVEAIEGRFVFKQEFVLFALAYFLPNYTLLFI